MERPVPVAAVGILFVLAMVYTAAVVTGIFKNF
jgi:hypothetical protein